MASKWMHEQTFNEYVDFSTELLDIGNGDSIDMRLTFDVEQQSAYLVLTKLSDLQPPLELLSSEQINVSWDEGLRQLGDQAEECIPILAEALTKFQRLSLAPDEGV